MKVEVQIKEGNVLALFCSDHPILNTNVQFWPHTYIENWPD